MLQGAVSGGAMLCLSCCLLFWVCAPAEGVGPVGPFPTFTPIEPDFEDWELGSGWSPFQLFHGFPADSPFPRETPGKPVNCSQRFWLPPYSAACWENLAEPEEFAKCRLLVLQNRAALQAVSVSSGVEEGGVSYDHQAREEVEGIRSDHINVTETVLFMERVFAALEERRKEGEEQGILTRMKERLSSTRDTMDVREHTANHLEAQFSVLEKNLLNMQLRLNKLNQQ